MKKLLSDEIVELILDNIKGISYTDILDMIDNEDIYLKEEKELDDERSIYSTIGTRLIPAYNKTFFIVVKDIELPLHSITNQQIGTVYDSNKFYLQKLLEQYTKFQRKVVISADEIKKHLEQGYRVFYDGTDGVSVFNVDLDSEFTIEDIFELKFYVIK